MVWTSDVESAKSIADLKTSHAIIAAKLQMDFEVLDSKIASGVKKIINGDFKRKRKRFLTGRQVAWTIYECFKVSDTDESVLYFYEILKVEVKNDTIQPFNTRWDIAMKKQPDEEIQEKLFYRQLQQSEPLRPLLLLYIQGIVQKG